MVQSKKLVFQPAGSCLLLIQILFFANPPRPTYPITGSEGRVRHFIFPLIMEGCGSKIVPSSSVFFFINCQKSYSSLLIPYTLTCIVYNTLNLSVCAGIKEAGAWVSCFCERFSVLQMRI